jgi:hypothetical protein
MDLIEVHKIAQELVDTLSESVEQTKGTIQGVALLYNKILELEQNKKANEEREETNSESDIQP